MIFLNGLTLLLIFQFMGEISVRLLALPIPGPVVGMMLLFIYLLLANTHKSHNIHHTANTLLGHLSLLFVPAGVGLMVHFDKITSAWLSISTSIIIGVIITILSTAWLMLLTLKLQAIMTNPKANTSHSKTLSQRSKGHGG